MTVTLRSRLLLGYGYLVGLLVVAGAVAALSFNHLGRSIDRILRENFRSVAAATAMLESLERQDSATLEALLGRTTAVADLESSAQAFRLHLADARENVTIAGEEAILERIAAGFERYAASRETLIAARPEHPLEAYERGAFPAFEEVKGDVIALLNLNHQAVIDADRRARSLASASSLGLAALVGVALLSLGVLSRGLRRNVLQRLEEAKAAAHSIRGGATDVRVRVLHDDELGMLARELNRALDAADELEASMMGRLAEQRQTVLALLGLVAGEAAVIGLDGGLVAATLPEAEAETVAESSSLLHQLSRLELMEWKRDGAPPTFEVGLAGGRRFAARLLIAAGARPVGWLLTRAA